MLIYLNLFFIISPLVASGCDDFTVSSCYPDSTQVIITVPLPSSPTATSTCSSLCNIQEDCLTWFIDGSSSTCSLLHYSFLSSCLSISGTADQDISNCLDQDSGSCGDLVDQDCEFTGTLLLNTTAVVDAHACQEYLRVLGPVYGAAYFSYNSLTSLCSLYESSARSCSSMSGPRGDLLEKCQVSTTPGPSTVSSTPSPSFGSEVLVSGMNFNFKAYNTKGVCASFYPHPEKWQTPKTMSFLKDSVIGCGASGCCCGGCDFINWSRKCWKFNMMNGWSEMAHPYDSPVEDLNNSYPLPLSGGLVNVNGNAYYVGEWGNVMLYNDINDSWSEVSRFPENNFINNKCVLSIGNMEIFVKTVFQRKCFKFNVVTKKWIQINSHHHERFYDQCMVVNLPSNGKGILSVGGEMRPNYTETRIAELLDLGTGEWSTVSPTLNEHGQSPGLFLMDGKPSIPFRNEEENGALEQYDVERNVWEMRDYGDASSSIALTNAINVPLDMFPGCSLQ